VNGVGSTGTTSVIEIDGRSPGRQGVLPQSDKKPSMKAKTTTTIRRDIWTTKQ
jgi:hypothetical protein